MGPKLDRGGVYIDLLFILIKIYIPNLYTLLILKLLERVPSGGNGWVLESHFRVQLMSKPIYDGVISILYLIFLLFGEFFFYCGCVITESPQ